MSEVFIVYEAVTLTKEQEEMYDRAWNSLPVTRRLVLGSPWPSLNFFFKEGLETDRSRLPRPKVVKITAEDTPLFKIGLSKKEAE